MIFLARVRTPSEEAWTALLIECEADRGHDWVAGFSARAARRARLQLQAELAILAAGAILLGLSLL